MNAGKQKFSDLMDALDEKVNKLREGQLDLDESIQLYKQAMDLAKQCEQRLKQAKIDIEKVEIPEIDDDQPPAPESDEDL